MVDNLLWCLTSLPYLTFFVLNKRRNNNTRIPDKISFKRQKFYCCAIRRIAVVFDVMLESVATLPACNIITYFNILPIRNARLLTHSRYFLILLLTEKESYRKRLNCSRVEIGLYVLFTSLQKSQNVA